MGEAAVSVRPGTRSLLTSALAGPLATLASIIESRKALSAAISCRGPSPHTWSQEGLQSVFERSFELRAQVTALSGRS